MAARPDPAWTHSGYCDAVEAEIGRFAGAVRAVDGGTSIPTCPDWTLAGLIRHVGTVHRWAGAMVRDLAQRRYGRDDFALDLPARTDEYADWLAAGARLLVPALRAADPDAPMWAWGADRHARFWSRRMLHETTVHRADAELALGRDPQVDADVAADGIEEFFANLPGAAASFAPDLAKLRGHGETIRLVAGDRGTAWLVTFAPDGVVLRRAGGDGPGGRPGDPDGGADGDAAMLGGAAGTLVVRAAAADLMLFVWGRRKPGDAHLDISGDTAVLDRWIAHSAL
jgi:uncharacterized protein (TIGR03083 family)